MIVVFIRDMSFCAACSWVLMFATTRSQGFSPLFCRFSVSQKSFSSSLFCFLRASYSRFFVAFHSSSASYAFRLFSCFSLVSSCSLLNLSLALSSYYA